MVFSFFLSFFYSFKYKSNIHEKVLHFRTNAAGSQPRANKIEFLLSRLPRHVCRYLLRIVNILLY